MTSRKLSTFTICTFIGLMFSLAPAESHAQTNTVPSPVLVFTEKSDTVLTATIGGVSFGSVTLISSDFWTWSLPSDRPTPIGSGDSLAKFGWAEPGNTELGNYVMVAVGSGGNLDIHSDTSFAGTSLFPDGQVLTDKFIFSYADGTSEKFSVQFNDLGDVASSVPDAPSTAGMLLLSTGVLLAVSRRIKAVRD